MPAYQNGLLDANAAARLPWIARTGPINAADRAVVDDAIPNNWPFYALSADGTRRIHYLNPVDLSNTTMLDNPNGVRAFGLLVLALTTPTAPTLVVNGTAGSTTISYKIVARNGYGGAMGSTPASAAGTTTTANATLTAANSITLTWANVGGAAFYDVYRTAAGGTPSTTGLLATVPATISNSTGFQPATYTYTDIGGAADGTTAPTVNTTGLISAGSFGDITVLQLATPVNVVATPQGTVGTTTITYKIVALSQNGHTAASAAGTTTTANATLTAANAVLVTWDVVPGAQSYNVYRTAAGGTSPTTTGLIGNVINATSLLDTGLAGDSSTAPTTNTTGGIVASGGVTGAGGTNYIATETGANNAIVAAGPVISVGMIITIQLAHSLQAGANTLNYNAAGAVAVKSHFNPANNLATAYATTGVVQLEWNGSAWLDLSQ
jgi:hypothetical protein